ncbi:MAG: hypothetical protein MZW92_39495 [Comamonadaceae bacterium]|nr:hypothetical protein [Comamonadaceae bacterium]
MVLLKGAGPTARARSTSTCSSLRARGDPRALRLRAAGRGAADAWTGRRSSLSLRLGRAGRVADAAAARDLSLARWLAWTRDFAGKALRRGAGGAAAGAAADGAGLLPAGRASAARSPLGRGCEALTGPHAGVHLRGPAAGVGDLQPALRDPADAARLRGDPARRAARRPRAAACRRWQTFAAHRAAAGLAGRAVGGWC